MTADFLIKCRKTGIFFSDLYVNAIVVTNARYEAMLFPDEACAQRAIDISLKPIYSTFDWYAVPAAV